MVEWGGLQHRYINASVRIRYGDPTLKVCMNLLVMVDVDGEYVLGYSGTDYVLVMCPATLAPVLRNVNTGLIVQLDKCEIDREGIDRTFFVR